jgi:hypothetical protein
MLRGILTALVVLVWLAVTGSLLDFDSNADRGTPKTANADLVMPAEVDEILNDLRNIVAHIERHPLTLAVSVPGSELKQKTFYSKEDSRIYKLHGVFRI